MTEESPTYWTRPVPPLDEQKDIAKCLTAVDALIDAQKKQLEDLEAHKAQLMKTFFESQNKRATG